MKMLKQRKDRNSPKEEQSVRFSREIRAAKYLYFFDLFADFAVPKIRSADGSTSVKFIHNIPVHHVPEGGDVVWAAVLVVQVISVFPDIES